MVNWLRALSRSKNAKPGLPYGDWGQRPIKVPLILGQQEHTQTYQLLLLGTFGCSPLARAAAGRTRDQPSLEPAGVMHDPDELLLTHLAVPVAVHLLRVALFVTKPREIRTGTANPGASAFSLPSRSRPKVNAYMTTLVLFILLLPRSCDGSRPRPAARARHCTPCGASLR